MMSREVKSPLRAYFGPAVLLLSALSILVFCTVSIRSIYLDSVNETAELTLKREKLEDRIRRQEIDIAKGAQISNATDAWSLETPTLALSSVQKKIGELSKKSKIELRSFRKTTYAGEPSEQGFAVAVRVEGNASLDAFYGFTQLIETHSPKLFIVDASVRRLTRQTPKNVYPHVFFILTIVAPMNVKQGQVQ